MFDFIYSVFVCVYIYISILEERMYEIHINILDMMKHADFPGGIQLKTHSLFRSDDHSHLAIMCKTCHLDLAHILLHCVFC